MIQEIQKGSAAEQAGLRPIRRNAVGDVVIGDVITAVDDQKVENNDSLVDYVDTNKEIGDKINLRFIRDQKEYGTTAILQELTN